MGFFKEYGVVRPLMRMGDPGKGALLGIQANFPPPNRPGETDRRVWALEAACEAFPSDSEVRDRATKELESEHVEMRLAAVRCLRLTLGKEGISPLRGLLAAASWEVRTVAAGELGKLGDRLGYEPMLREMTDTSLERAPRCKAASALGHIGDEAAFPALRDAIRGGLDCADVALFQMFPPGDPRRRVR